VTHPCEVHYVEDKTTSYMYEVFWEQIHERYRKHDARRIWGDWVPEAGRLLRCESSALRDRQSL